MMLNYVNVKLLELELFQILAINSINVYYHKTVNVFLVSAITINFTEVRS